MIFLAAFADKAMAVVSRLCGAWPVAASSPSARRLARALVRFPLAQMDPADPAYHYHRVFVQPLPVWGYWYLLLLPLCAGVAIVYKSIKCRSMSRVPREATGLFLVIVGGMIAAALVLFGLVRLTEG